MTVAPARDDSPILFTDEMVTGLLLEAARPGQGKSKSRRPIKAPTTSGRFVLSFNHGVPEFNFGPDDRKPNGDLRWHRCPYGEPGDLVWVRETWREDSPDDPQAAIYRADQAHLMPKGGKWKPNIHMPRWASRLTLRLTDVSVQRLQGISETDALAEGVSRDSDGWFDYEMPGTRCCNSARDSFRTLWSSLNGPQSWDTKSWVWALSFEVIKLNIDQVRRSAVGA